jgi:hypothetical protein
VPFKFNLRRYNPARKEEVDLDDRWVGLNTTRIQLTHSFERRPVSTPAPIE